MKGALFLIAALWLAAHAYAQSPAEVDEYVVTQLSKINTLGKDTVKNKASLMEANNQLAAYLLKAASVNGIMEAHMLKSMRLGNNIYDFRVTNSGDNKLRIFSWNTYLGGKRQHYRQVIYYCGSDQKIRAVEASQDEQGPEAKYPVAFCSDICSVKTNDHKTIYLTEEVAWLSRIKCEIVTAYFIKENSLEKYPIFENGSATGGIEYDMNSWRKRYRGPDLHFNLTEKKLFIPRTEGLVIFESYDVYKFDGNKFIKTRNW